MGLELEIRTMTQPTDRSLPSHPSGLDTPKKVLQSLWKAQDSFSVRERHGLHIALGALALALLWRFAWMPVHEFFSPPSATLQSLNENIDALQRLQQEVNAVRALPTVPLSQGQKSFEQITQNVLPQAQMRFNDRQVSVSLTRANPEVLSKWLLSLKEQVACKVVQSDLSRSPTVGGATLGSSNLIPLSSSTPGTPSTALWSGRVVFEFANEP
jgi:type II secretory pathway component PulM